MLNASQVALSVILPVVSAPLIWFTSRRNVMSVEDESVSSVEGASAAAGEGEGQPRMVDLSNSWTVSVLGGIIWVFITGLNLVSLHLLHLSISC